MQACGAELMKPRSSGAAVLLAGAFLFSIQAAPGRGVSRLEINDIRVSLPFFNPSLGQKIGISFTVRGSGVLDLAILDRDGFLVRRLVVEEMASEGVRSYEWNGRDDAGNVVPDEAFSLKIDLRSKDGVASYCPGNRPAEDLAAETNYYDPRTGTLSYKLPKSARVHAQAGSARTDPKTGEPIGVVLKTIVNRQPRPAGAVIESWEGLDESGAVRVPELPNFVIAIAATSLPENAIITIGNRQRSFLAEVPTRKGTTLLTSQALRGGHHRGGHHRGLEALEDQAPDLKLALRNGTWSDLERLWTIAEPHLELTVSVEGPSAVPFARQPGHIVLFLDYVEVQRLPTGEPRADVKLKTSGLSPGVHHVTVNWASDYGPVAVNSIRFKSAAAKAKGDPVGKKR